MVHYQIDYQPYISVMAFFNKLFDIIESAELGHDGSVIAYIISVIRVRRVKERRTPHGIGTQVFDVIKLFYDPFDISYPVTVAVLEGSRIYLIEYSFLPPGYAGLSRLVAEFALAERIEDPDECVHKTAADLSE